MRSGSQHLTGARSARVCTDDRGAAGAEGDDEDSLVSRLMQELEETVENAGTADDAPFDEPRGVAERPPHYWRVLSGVGGSAVVEPG